MLMCSSEKGDFNLTPRTVARLVLEAGQEHRHGGGNSSNGSTASNSPRSTPGSSPSLRRRVLGGGRSSETEGGGGGEKGAAESPLPSIPSGSSLGSAYPLASRHFSRNAKKMQSWYNVLSPTYKQRNEDFRKLFKKLPDTERLIVDYSCALQKDILLQGRLYLSENWLCFYSNIFRWETTITIPLKDVTSLTKEKTAKLIPNAIQISTDSDKHFFTSFGARDRSFMMIFRLWQNALMDKTLSPKELWHIVHQCYGTELGLTSEDDDYVSPLQHLNGLLPGEESESVSDLLELGSASLPGFPPCGPLSPLGETPPGSSSHLSVEEVSSLCRRRSSESLEAGHSCCPPMMPPAVPPSSSAPTSSATSFNLEEALDIPVESINHMLPPSTSSMGNLSSLDVTNDDELPTDLSNSSDTQEESQFPTPTYSHDTAEHNNPLGPKTAPVVDTQSLLKSSSQGHCYVVDSEVITSGIPYQDYFYTIHRYCLTSLGKNKSRIRVSSDICYRKQPWSLVKALIEKNTWSGIEEYYKHMESEVCKLETLLQSEVSVVTSGEAGSIDSIQGLSALRRRKRLGSRRANDAEREGPTVAGSPERGERGLGDDRDRRDSAHYRSQGEHSTGHTSVSTMLLIVSFMICVSLVVLVALNVLLFYKLYSLEKAAHNLDTWSSDTHSPSPQTPADWLQVLQLQRRFHQNQLNKWQQILSSSVSLLDQMKRSLEKLQQGIPVPEVQQESPPPPPTERHPDP
ncbi:protein Aster-A [Gadus morhua]|uniref:protein Aster-A n=1 Tax=Gadus morhua TaxID=8049 RepID=UPI0011B7E0FF|nr:protein Aster-A-like [Gadus morhua]